MKTTIENKAEQAPALFEIMAEWKSYEIQNWLTTIPPAAVRALFETGAKLETDRRALLEALKLLLNVPEPMTATEHFDYSANATRIARAAIAQAEREL